MIEDKKPKRMLLYFLTLAASLALPFSSSAYAGCTLSTTSINLGSYDFLSSAAVTGTGSITLACRPGADVTVAIGPSSNSGGFYPRMMQHSVLADTLDYNIYTNSAMVQVWGDGTNGTATAFFRGVTDTNIPIMLYAKIVPLQNISAGSYSEHLIVTINY